MADLPADLRTIVALKSWEDPKFAAELKDNPKGAVEGLAKSLGLDVSDVNFKVVDESSDEYLLVVPDNPMGASPADMRSQNSEVVMLRGGGTVNSYTADCGCGNSYTGGCSCGSIFGTPCLACATVLLC